MTRAIANRILAACAIGFAVLGSATTAHAGLIGGTIEARYDFDPCCGTIYGPETAVISDAVEFGNLGGSLIIVDVSDTSILITWPSGWNLAENPTITFDGLVFSDVGNTLSDIIAVSLVATNIPGLTGANLSFNYEQVLLDLLGIADFTAQSFVEIGVSLSEVPIPAAAPLFVAGLAGVAGASRRKRKA